MGRRTVWWNAGREGAVYCGVPVTGSLVKGSAVWLMNPVVQPLARLPEPDVVISSKPDVYDARWEQFADQFH